MDVAAWEFAVVKRLLENPFLLFSGREEFLKERALLQLIEKYIAHEDRSENVIRFDFASFNIEEFVSRLNSFVFNSSYRIFILDKPEGLAASARRELLKKLSTTPIPERTFIVVMSNDNKTIGEFVLALEEKSEKIDFWPPFENKLPEWIQKEAERYGKKLAPNAAAVLLQNVGPDLRTLSKELEKVCLSQGEAKYITAEHISTSVAYMRQDTIFDLLEAVGMRSLPKALILAESLLSKGESLIGIWYMLSRMLRNFKLLHDIAIDRPDLGLPLFQKLNEIKQLSGKTDFKSNQMRKNLIETVQKESNAWHPLLVEVLGIDQTIKIKNLTLASNFNRSELIKITSLLVKVDADVKNSPPNETLFLQQLLTTIITGRSQR